MRVLKTPEGEIVLDVTGRKTVAAHIFVSQRNVCRKPSRTKAGTFLKMQIPQEVYENLERELDTIEL